MTFLAPVFLAIAAAAAVGVVFLHLITRDRPPRAELPTARFVPARVEKALSRATRPADPLLLALRVLLIVLAGAAFARPVLEPDRRDVARIVVLDRSRATADVTEARDSALAWLGEGDALVLVDSAARVLDLAPRDSLAALGSEAGDAARGSLSAALIAVRRAARTLRDQADSIEVVVVSPLVSEELDLATSAIRAQWPGRVRLVNVRAAAHPAELASLDVRAGADDPLRATAALLGAARPGTAGVRIVRTLPTRDDSSFARNGGVLVVWPSEATLPGWSPRGSVDTVGAVIAGGVVLVAPFERRHVPPRGAHVAARWVDGEPAAIERDLGAGCVREVAVPIDAAGDLALRVEMQRLLAALTSSCGGERRLMPVADSMRARLAGGGALALAEDAAPAPAESAPLVPWLLGAALLIAIVEPVVRRRSAA